MRIITRISTVLFSGVLVFSPQFHQATAASLTPFADVVSNAAAGDVLAQFTAGDRLHRGLGVGKDDAAAAKWFDQAGTNGLADAQFMMGVLSENGWGVEKNEAAATGWYRKAAEQNHASAAFTLASRYAKGQGVDKDDAEATKWFMHAAELGDVSAQFSLAQRYATGLGVANDFGEAARWCHKAAEKGDASAQFTLAMLYADGHAVPPEPETPLTWFRKAAEQNHVTAQYCLGYRLAHSGSGKRAEKEGAQWLTKAAEAGDAAAEYELGVLYTSGLGVRKSSSNALKWFLVSAVMGNESAPKAVVDLDKELGDSGSEDAYKEAQEIVAKLKPGATVMPFKPAEEVEKPAKSAKTEATLQAEAPKPEVIPKPAEMPKPTATSQPAETAPKKLDIQQLEAAVKDEPTNYVAVLNLATGYLENHLTNRACEMLDQIIDARWADKDSDALSAIAKVYSWSGYPPKTETALEKLVKLEPRSPDAWYDLATVRAVLHKESESLMALKTSLGFSKKRLAKDDKARDILAEARKDQRFDAFRDSTAFKKIVPAVE